MDIMEQEQIKTLEAMREGASLFERIEIEDAILEIKKRTGDVVACSIDNEGCEACGA